LSPRQAIPSKTFAKGGHGRLWCEQMLCCGQMLRREEEVERKRCEGLQKRPEMDAEFILG
jgi:hypothetical protein